MNHIGSGRFCPCCLLGVDRAEKGYLGAHPNPYNKLKGLRHFDICYRLIVCR